jgi:hypothetical protein
MDGMQQNSYKDIFQKNRYVVVREFIPKDVADFIYKYTLMKEKAVKVMSEVAFMPKNSFLGGFEDPQSPGSFSAYADFATEALLLDSKEKMEEVTGLSLVTTYSYTRIYYNGASLEKHKDRESCEISATLSLGFDNSNVSEDYNWGIFMDGEEVKLNPGDLVVYHGNELDHWRDEYKGNHHCQVFLHYNDLHGKFKDTNKYDGRRHLGLPLELKGW